MKLETIRVIARWIELSLHILIGFGLRCFDNTQRSQKC